MNATAQPPAQRATNPSRMIRALPIVSAILGAVLLLTASWSAANAAEKSTGKKKSSTASTRKKAASEDTNSAPAGAGEKTSTLDLPLPARLPGNEGAQTTPDKKSAPAGAAAETGEKKSNPPLSAEGKPPEKSADTAVKRERAPNATVEPEAIADFSAEAPRVQQLMRDAIDLTRLNLDYTFGSADPDSGGMDCSGTIYYLLRAHGFSDVPRDSAGQYLWARRTGTFFPVVCKSAESVELNDLLPGDLMFWTGTYDTTREIPISHVMLYLGREKRSGKRIMFGASDGRSYDGIQRWGVSVFDFKMPKTDAMTAENSKVDFVGYTRIPGLRAAAPTKESGASVESERKAKSAASKGPESSKATDETSRTPIKSNKKKSAPKAD